MGMSLLPDAGLPKLLHYLAGTSASLVVVSLGTRLWDLRAGLIAAIVVMSTPMIWWVGQSAYTDLWVMLFVTAAAESLLLFGRRPAPSLGAVTGLLLGAALGTKITAAAVTLPLAGMACWWIVRTPVVTRRRAAFGAVAFGIGVTGGFSYLRAWLLTDNPIFPMFNTLLHGRFSFVPEANSVLAAFGMGRGVVDFLALPWRITQFPARFTEVSDFGILYLALFPALAAGWKRAEPWIATVVAITAAIWFVNAQYLRFFLPVLPLAALTLSSGLFPTVPQGALRQRAAFAAVIVLLTGTTVSAAGWIVSGDWNFPLSVTLRRVSRDDYAALHVGGYRVAQYARHALPADSRISGLGEPESYYYGHIFVPSTWHGRIFRDQTDIMRAPTGTAAQELLREAGFSHAVVNRLSRPLVRNKIPNRWVAREAFWEEPPWLEYAYRERYLFRLDSRHPRARARGANLLPVPGAWTRVPSGSFLLERLSITPGSLYALDAEARYTSAGGRLRLFIQWLDEHGRVLDYTTWREVEVNADWRRVATACSAPPTAKAAHVWLIAFGDDIEVRRVSFYELK
jgi:hypothetical protein